ncbi:MAG: DUF7249 family protein [Ktedonobacterales bacterium]
MARSADERGYNGWTNYATWNVHLWLTNDPQTEATYGHSPSGHPVSTKRHRRYAPMSRTTIPLPIVPACIPIC